MTPKRKTTTETVTVSIRFPRPLYDLIKRVAADNNRSFNQEVIRWVKVMPDAALKLKEAEDAKTKEG